LPSSIIFVCLGNICRSPIAEGVAKKIATEHGLHVKVTSAGTSSYHTNEAPCENSIKVASQHNVDISQQKAKQVTLQDFKEFEMVIALDSSNYENLKSMGATNLFKLGDFGFDGKDVPDPYFFDGFEGFDKVYNMIEMCVTNILLEK